MRATIAPKTHELIQFPWCLLRWGPKNRWRCRWRRRPLGKGGSWHHQQGKSRPRRDDPLPCVILGLCFEVTRRLPFRFGLRPQTLPQDSASRENTYLYASAHLYALQSYSAVIFSVSSRFTAVAASISSLTPTSNFNHFIPSPLPGLPFSSPWSGLYIPQLPPQRGSLRPIHPPETLGWWENHHPAGN